MNASPPPPLDLDAFVGAVGRAYETGDVERYAALFDVPVGFYGDSATHVLTNAEALGARLRSALARRAALGVIGHTARIDSVRPYAGHLTAIRVRVRLDLDGGLSADEREELWILRESDGRQRLCLAANSSAAELLEHRRPEPPARPSPARNLDQLVERIETTFNARDVEGHAALFDTPVLCIGDTRTDVLGIDAPHTATVAGFFDALDPKRLSVISLSPRAERPYGRSLAVLRVGVAVIDGAGHRADPHEELWLVRENEGALSICAIVNAMTARFLATPPEPRSPR